MNKKYIYVATCKCGKMAGLREKPNKFSLLVVGNKRGVFPLMCDCGNVILAEDFKRRENGK